MAQTSATIPLDERTLATPTLYNNPVNDLTELYNGWIALGLTATYASATSFTVAADVTPFIRVGSKILLTQTTAKYFYVTAVSYSAPDTTVTVTGGTDFTLANAAITAPFYSNIATPQGFPHWFSYTPTFTASGSMTIGALSIGYAKFCIIGRALTVQVQATFTTGGTASTTVNYTLPVTAEDTSANLGGWGMLFDPAAVGAANNIAGSGTLLANRRYDNANWSLGTGRQVRTGITYEI
jgi:hypothetical protein